MSICNGITIIRSTVVTIHPAFARSTSNLYKDGGIKAVKPTGIEDNMSTILVVIHC